MAPVALEDLDRRLAVLEGWKESQEQFTRSIKDEVLEVQNRITAFQQHVDHRLSDQDRAIGELRSEMRDDMGELRSEMSDEIGELSRRVDAQRSELKAEISELTKRMDTQTRWIVGLQFLTLLTLVGALFQLAQ